MVNEVVMYQSMFVLGIIMFAFFTTSFSNYTDFAESVTIENNLQRVLQEVNQELMSMIDKAASYKNQNGFFQLTVSLSLDSSYATDGYTIQPIVDTDQSVYLAASVQGDIVAKLPINLINGTNLVANEFVFSGSLHSSSIHTQITYSYNSLLSQSVTFSS